MLVAVAVGVAGVRADDKLENQELLISLQIAAAKIQALEAAAASAKDKNDALAQSAAAAKTRERAYVKVVTD